MVLTFNASIWEEEFKNSLQSGLQREFLDMQGYTEKFCLIKQTKKLPQNYELSYNK